MKTIKLKVSLKKCACGKKSNVIRKGVAFCNNCNKIADEIEYKLTHMSITVLNQNRDCAYTIKNVFYKKHFFAGIFMGFNIVGVTYDDKKVMLGTFDEDIDAKFTCEEILRLMHKGEVAYTIPLSTCLDEIEF